MRAFCGALLLRPKAALDNFKKISDIDDDFKYSNFCI